MEKTENGAVSREHVCESGVGKSSLRAVRFFTFSRGFYGTRFSSKQLLAFM